MLFTPTSLIEFQHRFADEAACAAWLYEMRWRDGFVCPRCGNDKAWALETKAFTYECTRCHRQTSVTSGTVMHGSKITPDGLVLGSFFDDHPFQRYFRLAVAGPVGPWFL